MKVLLLLVAAVCMLGVAHSYPAHASCKITWSFGMSCANVSDALVKQMHKWNMSAPCSSTEKCLYTVVSVDSAEIKATHTTPVKHYVDDLSFKFQASSADCTIMAYSTSETWYAVLDYGTNYCNLRNLADGSGLSKSTGFKEDTSDSVCTQYSSHDCGKY